MNQKARACIVSPEIVGPHRNGGVGTHCYYLAAFLSRQLGQQVTFLYTGKIESRTESYWREWFRKQLDIDFVWLPPPKSSGPALAGQGCGHARTARQVYEWLRAQTFEVCHFQDIFGNGFRCFQAKRTGLAFEQTALTCTVHSPREWIDEAMQSLPATGVDNLESRFLERYSIEHCDILITPNQYMQGWLDRNQFTTCPRKQVLPYLFDPNLRALGSRPVARHLIFFGRLEVRKGLLLFLETLLGMDQQGVFSGRKLKVSFVGRSGYTPDGGGMESIQKFRGWFSPAVEVELVTDLDQPEALSFLATHNDALVVCPSLLDNSPYAVIECLQLGLNIIAANSGGISELFVGQERLFEPTPEPLAAKLQAGLNDQLPAPAKRYDLAHSTLLWRKFCQETVPNLALPPKAKPARSPAVRVFVGLGGASGTAVRVLEALRSQSADDFSATVFSKAPLAGEVERFCQAHGWKIATSDLVLDPTPPELPSASARYAVFLTPGCVPRPCLVERLVQSLEGSGLDALTCFAEVEDEQRPGAARSYDPLGPCLEAGLFTNLFSAGCLIRRLEHSLLPPDVSRLLRIDGQWCELIDLAMAGRTWDVLPEPLVFLCEPGAASLSANLDYRRQMEVLNTYGRMQPNWLRHALAYVVAAERKLQIRGHEPHQQVPQKVAREARRIIHQIRGLYREVTKNRSK